MVSTRGQSRLCRDVCIRRLRRRCFHFFFAGVFYLFSISSSFVQDVLLCRVVAVIVKVGGVFNCVRLSLECGKSPILNAKPRVPGLGGWERGGLWLFATRLCAVVALLHL